jgi:hypothetical protein
MHIDEQHVKLFLVDGVEMQDVWPKSGFSAARVRGKAAVFGGVSRTLAPYCPQAGSLEDFEHALAGPGGGEGAG